MHNRFQNISETPVILSCLLDLYIYSRTSLYREDAVLLLLYFVVYQ